MAVKHKKIVIRGMMAEQNYQDWISLVRERSDIVEVVRGYLELRKKGRNHWGCCPFHHEKTPSFAVNEERKFFHCFGCGESGDVLTFIMKIEGKTFSEAAKTLAAKYNIEVPNFSAKSNFAEIKAKKDRLYELTKETGKHYYNNLISSPNAAEARKYIENRGFGGSILTNFAIGYSLGYDQLIKHLEAKGFKSDEMIEAGVAWDRNGSPYDPMYNRLIVPIINSFNQVVGFGGRVLEKSDAAKYKNTAESILFEKNKELYGIHSLKKFKQKNKLEYVIIVEGYMDVIALNKAGFGNCVASMGTALTQEQARLLKRFCDKVVISYDGDSAGQKATLKGLDILSAVGLNVKVATMIEGLDPDEIIAKYGVERYSEILLDALPLLEYKLKTLAKEFDMTVVDERSKFALQAIKILKSVQEVIEREAYLPLVKEISGLPFEVLQRQLYEVSDIITKKANTPSVKGEVKNSAYHKAIRFILLSIFDRESFALEVEDLSPYLIEDEHKEIYDIYLQFKSEHTEIDESILQELKDNSEAKLLLQIKDTQMDTKQREKFFNDSLKSLKYEFIKQVIEDLSAECAGCEDIDRRNELKVKIFELSSKLVR